MFILGDMRRLELGGRIKNIEMKGKGESNGGQSLNWFRCLFSFYKKSGMLVNNGTNLSRWGRTFDFILK
jgi:hypothetical protein